MILPVYRLTLRALLLQRRTIMLAVVVLAPVATSLIYALARPGGSDTVDFYSGIVQKLFVPAVAALVALVFGVSAFGDEREDGTILYLVATPQPRLELVVAKVAAAWTASLALLVPSLVLSGLLGLGSAASLRLIGWPLLGVVLASLAYCAASSWLSLKTRRPVVIGVIYILLWEGSVATYAASAAKLSISAYGSAFVAHALPQSAPPVAGLVPSAAGAGGGSRAGGMGRRPQPCPHRAPVGLAGTGEQPAAEEAGHDGDQHGQQQHPEGELDRAEHAEHQDREDQKQKPDHALRIPRNGGR